MKPLIGSERAELNELLAAGLPLSEKWQSRLFPNWGKAEQVGKEYRLVYDGKLTREEVLAQTPAAPWQLEREFCKERPHGDGWRNLLVWGDNLSALRELLVDQQGPNLLKTRGNIKLIYIDPPFATRQDFMKDKEKAYRDKVVGSEFIEFLRRRLILLREVLAADGSIYVHLDTKKGHYIKAVLDEVFGEENFQNEVIWKRTPFAGSSKARAAKFPINHDSIFFYSRTETYRFSHAFEEYSAAYKARFKHQDENGWYRKTSLKTYSKETEARLRSEGRFIEPVKKGAYPSYKQYLHESKGKQLEDIWTDINIDNPMAQSRVDFKYPTLKPEALLARIIRASSAEGDVVLDCFAGSGTTAAVAEKLRRRWIAMDCGKLAIYTTQKRLFSLTTNIGAAKKDDRTEPDRVEDWSEHLKGAPGVLLVTEKARKGECDVTLDLLHDLAELAVKRGLVKKGSAISLLCSEEKLRIPKDKLEESEDGPGTKRIKVAGVEFRMSFIVPKDKPEKERLLGAKEFALYRAGVYDMTAIRELPWTEYRPFVLKLFGVREHPHTRYGLLLNGYIGTNSVLLWDYPDHPTATLDYGYVDDLQRTLRGKAGERFYVIAPVVAMAFAEDEVVREATTYVFLKVPLSVLLRLIEKGAPAALKQPANEDDVNEVIDSVGFDFISQPLVVWKAKRSTRKDGLFTLTDFVLEISEFRAQTLATEPEDFANFETFSMALVDTDYDGDVFRLSRVFWGKGLLEEGGGLANAERLKLSIPEKEFTGKRMMVILCDRYGNEKKLLLKKGDFEGKRRKAIAKKGRRVR
jgi:site-specific DNA-methyltransferase (adenine-specific)/adenine-specific DNA-methyltransferase